MTPPPADTFRPEPGVLRPRDEIPPRYKWDVTAICRDWDDWERSYRQLGEAIEVFKAFQGTLGEGSDRLLAAYRAMDEMGALAYRVWYYAALQYDQDQRDNTVNARRQQVQILFARQQQASSWFNPELLAIPIETIRGWLDAHAGLAVYRFAVESLFHEQEHVLDERGERLMSYAGRFNSIPHDSYAALTTADMKFPSITLSTGERVTLSYGQYRAVLETNRVQDDRASAYRAFHRAYAENQNTYAALYNGVLQRDWFHARARSYRTTLDAALHGNNIPPAVVENLIAVTREGVEPLRRYHRLRRRALGLETYRLFDVFVPLVDYDVRYPYDQVGGWIVDSVAPLGREYQQQVRRAFDQGWIDVFENVGKRHGAYSAPVYGAHPYMLLNYNETLDAVFTLAHEMGHSMHTLLSHQTQPFVYAGYTIFVAEVPSTLSEALFLDLMLERARSREERIVLLQHAIDAVAGTFYTQVLFADFELQAHRLVEQDQPITADALNGLFRTLLGQYYGDALDEEEVSRMTWARIPHFFSTPYYVYQYATCFASTAKLMQELRAADPGRRDQGIERYLALLRAGGSDYPMRLLARAGVDLSEPDTVRAVAAGLDGLVTRLEADLG
ncbi:MAG: oligoendopeptidase F [Acidobacteria bacterium RIFCSPLOWO2_02_FULL_68_18]|nr:MAG: oligoendopeptidase F [Acidobacteria bacterium RIFCSPLOWO2_02_FULL_68_18]OFW48040.1 MAG: oligoendopeptidase F [Acidobacteria bacterium RIFCSPLOWO2_12_FULL_68_19]